MIGGLGASPVPLTEQYDLALVDLDGVTYRGVLPIAGASESLVAARQAGMRLLFVTNNASRSPEAIADQLSSLHIPTQTDEVLTAAQAAAATLHTRLPRGAKVLVIGAEGLVDAVTAEGFVVVSSATDAPEAVVQGFGPDVGWTHLAEAAYAVSAGAWYLASNLDGSLPTARGYAPGNGALVAAVVTATGIRPDSSGKPSPQMYRLGVQRVGAARPLVIGDRLDTDLAGARAGGYPGLHVLTGVNSGRDDVLAVPEQRPTYIGADLRSLLESHPEPVPAGHGWWSCGGGAARVSDGVLELSGPDDVDLVRAACAAAWSTVDAGGTLDAATVPPLGPRLT